MLWAQLVFSHLGFHLSKVRGELCFTLAVCVKQYCFFSFFREFGTTNRCKKDPSSDVPTAMCVREAGAVSVLYVHMCTHTIKSALSVWAELSPTRGPAVVLTWLLSCLLLRLNTLESWRGGWVQCCKTGRCRDNCLYILPQGRSRIRTACRV